MTDERRLLMVGGDERLLARLRNLLRDEWELHQARTGEEALSWLKDHGAALVLAEGRLPGLDTASFLSRVRDDHPAAARLAFWPAGSAGTLPAIHSAQRTMRSTDSDESVLEAVQRTTVLQRLVSDEGVRRVVGRLDRLPSVPRTYWALVQAAGQPEKGMSEFAQIIESDPAMSVKVLQLVNSAFFGVSRRVTSIQQAVAILGIDLLKGLALTAHVFASFESQGLGGFSPELFQAYSVRVARLAKRFLEGRSNADEAFSAGLLHDLGKMIIAVRLPTRFAAITSLVAESKAPLYQIERDLIGVTHAEIGAYLLGMWGVPHAIVEAVALHHTPGQVKPRPGGDYAALAAVHAADALLGIYSCFDPEDLLDLEFLERAGFAHDLPRWHELAKEEAAKMAQ